MTSGVLYLPNMQGNIRIDGFCWFQPLLQNLRNGCLKLFVIVLVPVQYVYSTISTMSMYDVPKAFDMFVRVIGVMPNRLFDSFLKAQGTPSTSFVMGKQFVHDSFLHPCRADDCQGSIEFSRGV